MAIFVPYLEEEEIERDAAALLAEFEHARGVVIAPPIPIEDIVEKHLKLHVEFDDTHKLFGVPRPDGDPDILGANFFDEARIVIDESLNPEEHPTLEGRYRFTLGHEGGGHWRLHRHLFASDPAQTTFFGPPAAPSFVCRSSQAKKREEWQADLYASCLLMPRDLVFRTWRERFGNANPRVLRRNNGITLSDGVSDEIAAVLQSFDQQRYNDAMNDFVRPMARKFGVSMDAMRIRVERLGLLHREAPRQGSFTVI